MSSGVHVAIEPSRPCIKSTASVAKRGPEHHTCSRSHPLPTRPLPGTRSHVIRALVFRPFKETLRKTIRRRNANTTKAWNDTRRHGPALLLLGCPGAPLSSATGTQRVDCGARRQRSSHGRCAPPHLLSLCKLTSRPAPRAATPAWRGAIKPPPMSMCRRRRCSPTWRIHGGLLHRSGQSVCASCGVHRALVVVVCACVAVAPLATLLLCSRPGRNAQPICKLCATTCPTVEHGAGIRQRR